MMNYYAKYIIFASQFENIVVVFSEPANQIEAARRGWSPRQHLTLIVVPLVVASALATNLYQQLSLGHYSDIQGQMVPVQARAIYQLHCEYKDSINSTSVLCYDVFTSARQV